jgi:flagellar biosynthesis/type III secretory pathway chaperone
MQFLWEKRILEGVNKMEELLNILQKELNIYEQLLKISKSKTDIIKEGRTSELDTFVKQEEIFIADIIEFEKKRLNLVKNICKGLGLNRETISISELSQHVAQKEELLEFKEKITKTLKDLKKSNDLNSKLVKNSLEYINFAVNLATGASESSLTYEQKGQTNIKGQKNIFDIKL